jgi:hypothetical protein
MIVEERPDELLIGGACWTHTLITYAGGTRFIL